MTDYSASSNAVVSQPRTSRGAGFGSNGSGVNTSFMSNVADPGPGSGSFQSYFEQSVGRISRRIDTYDALNTHSNIIDELEEHAREQRQHREQRAEADRERSQRMWTRRTNDLEQAADISRIDERALSIAQESLRETLTSAAEDGQGQANLVAGSAMHAEGPDHGDRRKISEGDAENAMRNAQGTSVEPTNIDELEQLLGTASGGVPKSVSEHSIRQDSLTGSPISGQAVPSEEAEELGQTGAEAIQHFADTLSEVVEEIEGQLDSLERDREAYREVVEDLRAVLEKLERQRDPEQTADALEMLAGLIQSAIDEANPSDATDRERTDSQQNGGENAAHVGLGDLLARSLEQASHSVNRTETGENVRSPAEANGQVLGEAIERLVARLTDSTDANQKSAAGSDQQSQRGAARAPDDMNAFASNRTPETALKTGRMDGNEAERLVDRLREISQSLRNTSEARESEGLKTVEGRSRERSERVGELVIDVRDRRTRNDRSTSRHRESQNGAERASMVFENEQRSDRGVHATDHRRWGYAQGKAQNAGDEGLLRNTNVGSGEGRSSSGEANAAGSESRTGEGEGQFDRLMNTGAENTSGDRSARATGGSTAQVRSNPSSSSAELARSLREQGNTDIVRQARIILRDENSGELRLRLKPEGLGNVRIYMELDDKRVDIRILVENSSVRETFRENIAELQRAFESDGFTTGSFSVDIEGENAGDMSGNRQENGEGDADSRSGNASRGVHELDDAVPSLEEGYENERHINVMA